MNALLQTVKGMSSDIQAVSAAAEQDCKTPAPLIDQLHAEGVFLDDGRKRLRWP